MTALVDIELPRTHVALGELFEGFPEIALEVEPSVPLAADGTILVWVSNVDPERVIEALQRTSATGAVGHLARNGEKSLFQLEWTGESDPFIDALMASEATVLTASMDAETWTFRLQFPGHEQVTAFHEKCVDAGLDLTVARVLDIAQSAPDGRLTDAQRDALELAYAEGYFNVPRETDLIGLSEMLGISDTAASQRLRRGIETLVEEALSGEGGAGDGADVDRVAEGE